MVVFCNSSPIHGFFLAARDRYQPIRPSDVPAQIVIPKRLGRTAFVDRLVTHNIASLDEILQQWDINEVMRFNEILDIQEDTRWLAEVEARKGGKHGAS